MFWKFWVNMWQKGQLKYHFLFFSPPPPPHCAHSPPVRRLGNGSGLHAPLAGTLGEAHRKYHSLMTWQLAKFRDWSMIWSGTILWINAFTTATEWIWRYWLTVTLSACVLFEHDVPRRRNSSFFLFDYWQTTSSQLCRNAKYYIVTKCNLELELCVGLCFGSRAARTRKPSEVLHRSRDLCLKINHTASSRESYYKEQKQKQTKKPKSCQVNSIVCIVV